MKRSIKWHQEGLNALRTHLEAKRQEQERLSGYVDDLQRKVCCLSHQISKAMCDGRTEFDGERFMVPQKKKVPDAQS